MEADPIIFKTDWIAIRKSARGFQYLERKGKDSVAVFLIRRQGNAAEWDVLVRYQHLCIDNTEDNGRFNLFPCPITGGVEPGETPEAAAVRETYEETGYKVAVTSLGRYIVGTQTNEVCYLYYADVTGIPPSEALQDGSFLESVAHNQWRPFEDLQGFDYGACQLGYHKLKARLVN